MDKIKLLEKMFEIEEKKKQEREKKLQEDMSVFELYYKMDNGEEVIARHYMKNGRFYIHFSTTKGREYTRRISEEAYQNAYEQKYSPYM